MHCVNILYVITKLELGGAQTQLLSLIRHLDKTKFRPFLFTSRNGLLLSEACLIPQLTLNKSRFLERPINPLLDFLAWLELCRFIKKNGIVIVHTHSSKAGILGRLAARFSGVKVIIHTVHGWSFNDYQGSYKRRLFIWLERLTAGFSSRLIVVSRYDQEQGLVNNIGRPRKYLFVHYGIDREIFIRRPEHVLRKTLGLDSSALVVGMVACLKPQKSPHDFIRLASLASQDIPEAKFILVGDGLLRGYLTGLIARLKLKERVMLLGWRRDIPELLSVMDIFVLTSLWEGLPVSVLEALASARPVIATDTGGVREIIRSGRNGFVVPRHDIGQMRDKLVLLSRDNKLRIAMGEEAVRSLDPDFDTVRSARITEGLYSGLIAEKELAHVN